MWPMDSTSLTRFIVQLQAATDRTIHSSPNRTSQNKQAAYRTVIHRLQLIPMTTGACDNELNTFYKTPTATDTNDKQLINQLDWNNWRTDCPRLICIEKKNTWYLSSTTLGHFRLLTVYGLNWYTLFFHSADFIYYVIIKSHNFSTLSYNFKNDHNIIDKIKFP